MAVALEWIRGQIPEVEICEEARSLWKVMSSRPAHVFGYARSEGEARATRATVIDLLEKISEKVKESEFVKPSVFR